MKLKHIRHFIPQWIAYHIHQVTVPKAKRIHIIGDSHASFCFTNVKPVATKCEKSLWRHRKSNQLKTPFVIHWLGPVTMHRVGRDHLNLIHLKKLGASEKETAVFLFGEIDVRCHIEKQSTLQSRPVEEIIHVLVDKYIKAIVENKKLFQDMACVVGSIVPPTDQAYNVKFPSYGTLETRISLTQHINAKLKEACDAHGLKFLDLFTDFCTSQGILRPDISDKGVHIAHQHNESVKIKLLELLC